MPLNIKDEQTDRLARQLAETTGESITEAVRVSLSERLARLGAGGGGTRLADQIDRIALRTSRLPRLDDRSPDEILGYDDDGLPG